MNKDDKLPQHKKSTGIREIYPTHPQKLFTVNNTLINNYSMSDVGYEMVNSQRGA